MAGRAGLRLCARLRARTGAGVANRAALELKFLAAAKSRFFKRQRQVILQIAAALRRVLAPAAAASAAETAAETAAGEHIEDIFKPAETAKAASAGSAAHGGVVEAELIVARALLRVAEHFVGFVDLLKARFGLLVVRMKIRMAGLGRLAVSLFDFVVRSAFGYAEHLVVISFVCHSSHRLSSSNP